MRAPPITQEIVLAMAGLSFKRGELTMAALLLLGFHALLRTGELLQVRPCDFLLDQEAGLVSLPSNKSGVRNNVRESVSLDDMTTLETLRAMLELRTALGMSRVACWDRSGSAFRDLFQRLLKEVCLEGHSFKPYSLRRGGATYEMQCHGQMERCLLRGRWENSNVARIYITDGLSLLPSLSMSWEAKMQIARFSAVFTAEHQAFQPCGKRGKRPRI